MPAPVFYSLSPFGTGDIKVAANIVIASGVASLSAAQTGNIGVGTEIEYNSLHAYIAPNRIGFDSGSVEIKPDTKIADATSGATGIVRFVEVTGGTWGGGDAAGWIYFEKTTGTFGNNNLINRTKPTSSNNVATVNGTIQGNIGGDNDEFVVKSAVGADAANQGSTSVTSIHHVWASLSAFEGAFTGASYINNASLVAADVVAHACCYYDHDDQTADSTALTVDGTTTDATRKIIIFTPVGGSESINNQRSSGIWDANKANLQAAVTGSGVLVISDEDVEIQGLQIMNTHTSAGSDAACIDLIGSAISTFLADSCILRFESTAGTMSSRSALRGNSQSGAIKAINTVVYDVVGGTTQYTNGVQIAGNATWSLYFCSISNCVVGVKRENATLISKNCCVFRFLSYT